MLSKIIVTLLVVFTALSCINHDIYEDLNSYPVVSAELVADFDYSLDDNGFYHITVSHDSIFRRLKVIVYVNDMLADNARVEWEALYEVLIAGTLPGPPPIGDISFLNDFKIINPTSIAKNGEAITHVYIHPKFVGDTVSIVSTLNYYDYNEQEMTKVELINGLVLE